MSSQLNIYVDQGTDFRLTVQLFDDDDLDLPIANYDFFGDLKKLYSTKRAAEFEFEKDGNDITLLLSADVTSQLTPGKYQYDVMMRKQSGELSKIVDGLAFVISTITEV
jgi:hypothetical protein